MEEAAEVCFINIGPKQRRLRLMTGVIFFGIGVAIDLWLVMSGAPRLARLVLFLPFFVSAIGYFQYREKT
jgi:hypothetical protein